MGSIIESVVTKIVKHKGMAQKANWDQIIVLKIKNEFVQNVSGLLCV